MLDIDGVLTSLIFLTLIQNGCLKVRQIFRNVQIDVDSLHNFINKNSGWVLQTHLSICNSKFENKIQSRSVVQEKKEEIWLSPMTKAHTPAEMSKGQSDNITPQKSSITQRLRTDLGRSVGVTTATQLVWFTRFTGPNLPTHRNSRVIEDKNMQMVHYSDIKVANI